MDIKSEDCRFEARFNIELDLNNARERFVNRLFNKMDKEFLGFTKKECHLNEYVEAFEYIAYKLGMRYKGNNTFEYYSGTEFASVLKALEALYEAFKLHLRSYANSDSRLDTIIKSAISESEIDLGIQWREGLFYPSGAILLDEALVNEPLKWLADGRYSNTLIPLKKGLMAYMEAIKTPEKLADTITDMYEALEALAKQVTGRPQKDLSANAEVFIKILKLSNHYNIMLKNYISYANEYRHGIEPTKIRLAPNPNEVEAFIYMTGIFIRLAIKQIN